MPVRPATEVASWSATTRCVRAQSMRQAEFGFPATLGDGRFFVMADYHDLDVWHEAHALAIAAHNTAVGIRGGHYVSIRSQMIRAAISVPTNIVEGCEQQSTKDFIRFLRYSVASSSELEYHLEFSRDIHVITVPVFEQHQKKIQKVRKMLHGLIRSLQ